MADTYTGPVYYRDGWHWTTDIGPDGETVEQQKLYLEDDGTYRIAEDGDESWHDRKHQRFATFELEDASASTRVSEQELDAINELLGRMRGGGE